MFANEPDEVAKVRGGGAVADELEHARVLHAVDVQGDGAHGDADHRLGVVEELDGLRVEGKVVRVLVVEEVDGVRVQLQAQRLQEQHVVAHDVLVGEVELVHDYRVDVVVAEQVVCGGGMLERDDNGMSTIELTETGLVPDVLKEDVQRLQQLDTYEAGTAALLPHDVQEVGQHVLLEEEAVQGGVIN